MLEGYVVEFSIEATNYHTAEQRQFLKYFLKKSTRPKRKLDIKPRSTFFIDGTTQSHVGTSTVSTNCLPPSHSTTPPLPSDVEDHACTPVHHLHSPNITPLNFRTDLVVSPSSSHMHSFLRPSSSHRVFLRMMLSCVCPFRTLHLL